MLSFLKALADAVDGLCANQRATVDETESALTVASLTADDAKALLSVTEQIGWPIQLVDAAGELADHHTVLPDYAPFILTMNKPATAGIIQVVTITGLKRLLLQGRNEDAWELATLSTPFATMSASFTPWGTASIFSPSSPAKSPRAVVKDQNIPPLVPADIRTWLLKEPASSALWEDKAFGAFASLSAQALMRALAGEVKNDGSLVFKGPPHTQLSPPQSDVEETLGRSGYNDLRLAAAWVYENSAETEQRHGLFVAEFGRTHPTELQPALAFRRVATNVLEGARLAYQLSLSDLTREAIKAQGDLRKAVADDTAKLADNTRQVVTAVAAALATSAGLIAAKVATSTPHWVIQAVAIIAVTYVAAIVLTGIIFMSVQQSMRSKWRTRLYRFIPDEDYKAMVIDPSRQAESMFTAVVIAAGVLSGVALGLVFWIS